MSGTWGQVPVQVRTWAGYRHASRPRSTGSLVVLVDGWAQGLASPGDGDCRWFLICDAHDTILSGTQRDLRSHMACPEGWCDACRYLAWVNRQPLGTDHSLAAYAAAHNIDGLELAELERLLAADTGGTP